MVHKVNRLEHPIDVMDFIHNALRTEAARLEDAIQRLDFEESLQQIRLDFLRWAAGLMFHAEQEDLYMMRLLADCQPARDGEKEHVELSSRLEDVVRVFGEEIGKTKLIARTHRHLYGAVVALRIAQDDHLESEEAFILPVIRERLSEDEQLRIVQSLLVDQEAAEPKWVLDWLGQNLDPGELEVVSDLAAPWMP